MRSALILGLVAAVTAAPYAAPQEFDWADLDAAPLATPIPAPLDATDYVVTTIDLAAASTSIAAEVAAETGSLKVKRDECDPLPAGTGPTVNTPDTPAAFLTFPQFHNEAKAANAPEGYNKIFTDLDGSTQSTGMIRLKTLTSYNVQACADLCDASVDNAKLANCFGFNFYVERDPSLSAGAGCPNPASNTNYKCVLYSTRAAITAPLAKNKGQFRGPKDANGNSFQVVISGSNGYTRKAPPNKIPGFSAPVALPAAINAPKYQGANTYLRDRTYPLSGPVVGAPELCAIECDGITKYESEHGRAADGSYKACNFFQVFYQIDGATSLPQAFKCAYYRKDWDASYATNFGQYRNTVFWPNVDVYAYAKDSPIEQNWTYD